MAKLVFAILVIFSLASWAVIFTKALQLARARKQGEEFLSIFRRSSRFSEVSHAAERLPATPLAGLFQAGYAEIDAQIKAAAPSRSQPPDERPAEGGGGSRRYLLKSLPALERSLGRSVRVELAELARWTPFLATTAAATPFIGLFGTVWGIMVAFRDIGRTGSTSLVTVAPGIAEALINTAAGLFAAIPALVAYNYFANRLRRERAGMEDFVLEFLNLSERNFT